jgi:hypothetical protein
VTLPKRVLPRHGFHQSTIKELTALAREDQMQNYSVAQNEEELDLIVFDGAEDRYRWYPAATSFRLRPSQ